MRIWKNLRAFCRNSSADHHMIILFPKNLSVTWLKFHLIWSFYSRYEPQEMKLQMTNSRKFIAIPSIRNYISCDLYSMNHTVKWIIWVALPLGTIVVVVEVHPFNYLYLPQNIILNFNHNRLTIYICGWSSYFQTYLFQAMCLGNEW